MPERLQPYAVEAAAPMEQRLQPHAAAEAATPCRCLLEMWEAAVHQIPIVLFPVVGGGWSPDDARTLLSDLMGQMQALSPQP